MLQRLIGKGLNPFYKQSLLNGFLHFQKCLQHNRIRARTQLDHM